MREYYPLNKRRHPDPKLRKPWLKRPRKEGTMSKYTCKVCGERNCKDTGYGESEYRVCRLCWDDGPEDPDEHPTNFPAKRRS